MDLYLQFGHGMMGYCRDLISKWGEGTVILSPRDLTEEQTKTFTKQLKKINGKTLFDPQYYNPRADHHKLTQWSHWLNDSSTFETSLFSDKNYLEDKFEIIKEINDYCNTEAYIIPDRICENVDKYWFQQVELFLEQSNKFFNDKEKYLTLALSFEIMKNEDNIEKIIDRSFSWDVDGYYIVPEGKYLEEDPNWLINLALLVSGLKQQNKKVIVGYSSHQMLSLACANVDAIASGSFLNVRSFNSGKFDNPDGSISRRAVWYYCPQTLSEYRLRALDRAYEEKVLDQLKPFGKTNEYVEVLFQGLRPSSVKFGDSLAFKHYLLTLKEQCLLAKRDTFENTIQYHIDLADNAYENIRQLEKKRVTDREKSFKSIVDIYQDTIYKIEKERGAILKRKW